MRIVGGRLRGRALVAPKDMRVRPTADRTRESLFNILAHNDFDIGWRLEDARVLDLFAGTGALGCEALSRGAKFCLFADDDPDSRALQRQNVEALGLTGVTKIWRRDATALGDMPANANGPFTLVFADAPYAKGLTTAALTSALSGGWIAPGALVVVETSIEEEAPAISGLTPNDERIYGAARISLLTRPPAPTDH